MKMYERYNEQRKLEVEDEHEESMKVKITLENDEKIIEAKNVEDSESKKINMLGTEKINMNIDEKINVRRKSENVMKIMC